MTVYSSKSNPANQREGTLGRVRETPIYVGIVKKVKDEGLFMGRLAVWIPELGGDPKDEKNWFVVNYASPFAGVTDPALLKENGKKMADSQKSYGFWMTPPDVENHVLVCFANGDTSRGFWFACVYQQNMNHMVPGIPMSKTTDEKKERCGNLPPSVEYNKRDKGIKSVKDPERPMFDPLVKGLEKQGLFSDDERGPSTTGARRESPSKVYGWLTPRGNTVHVDDNEDNEFIRMRTRSGAQVLIHETTGYVYINSKNGNSWAEISDTGVDIYSKGTVSLRSSGNLNLHADGDLAIEADGALHLRSNEEMTFQSGKGIDFKCNNNLVLETGGKLSLGAKGNIAIGSQGDIKMGSSGQTTMGASGFIRSGGAIYDNAGKSAGSPGLVEAKVKEPGTLNDVAGSAPCYSKQSRKTIVSRLPTHEPFALHPKGGVSVPENATPEEAAQAAKEAKDGKGVPTNPSDRAADDNSPQTVACNQKVSENVLGSIREASSKTGVDFGYMMAMAKQESGFNPNAKASTSSASGLYQFTNGTWSDMYGKYGAQNQLSNNRMDPRSSAMLGAYYARDNQRSLQQAGLPSGPTELYTAHFLGAGGAKTFLRNVRDNPNGSAAAAMPQAAAANRNIFYDKQGRARTNQQVYTLLDNKIAPQAKCFSGHASAPQPPAARRPNA